MTPSVPPAQRRNDLPRRIHFFRADCGRTSDGDLIAFDPRPALERIDGLPFDSSGGRYLEVDENIYCCWVDSAGSSAKLRFAVIRRDQLPYVEDAGIVEALNIPDTAGLVEQIHVRTFRNNIVACEFNFYGPRLPRLGRYLNEIGLSDPPVVFEPLIRRDTAAELDEQQEIRVFELRVRRSDIDRIAEIDESLGRAFETTAEVSDADELEVVLRPKPYSRENLGRNLLGLVKRMARRDDIRDLARSFKVQVSPGDGLPSVQLDVLGDRFISDRRILRATARGRALDSQDAYGQIESAYRERRDELEKAASLAESLSG